MAYEIDAYPIPENCPFCQSAVIFTSNAEIYGREYGNGKCYKCASCDAYVGVHNNTNIPLGRMADRKLRELKKQCHALFDPVWKQNKHVERGKAYGRLAKCLGIPVNECHFGWFDAELLERAIRIMSDPQWCGDIH